MIIMLCNLEESGRTKCHSYWPTFNKPKSFSKFNVKMIEEEKNPDGLKHIKQRSFLIDNINLKDVEFKEKTVTQLHYVGWPDHEAPKFETSVQYFNYMFTQVEKNYTSNKSPTIVHCSAGIGRTGTFISIYILWNKIYKRYSDLIIENKMIEKCSLSIFNTVLQIKDCRCYSVENPLQYQFIYRFVIGILKSLKK